MFDVNPEGRFKDAPWLQMMNARHEQSGEVSNCVKMVLLIMPGLNQLFVLTRMYILEVESQKPATLNCCSFVNFNFIKTAAVFIKNRN
ncbi:hypothetical protein [Pantoea sp. C2G6]|uniref:hypothetical protein n=1 Tax=Pantoea sp. C2G6 TaxID=3243084 RepID=UPI003ED9D14C